MERFQGATMRGLKRRGKVGQKPHPPLTKRFCVSCEKMTNFDYNPRVLHSECGGRITDESQIDRVVL